MFIFKQGLTVGVIHLHNKMSKLIKWCNNIQTAQNYNQMANSTNLGKSKGTINLLVHTVRFDNLLLEHQHILYKNSSD